MMLRVVATSLKTGQPKWLRRPGFGGLELLEFGSKPKVTVFYKASRVTDSTFL